MLEKRNLYFINSRGYYRLLTANVTEQEANVLIDKFLEEHKFESYYSRSWDTDEGRMYDVGSWNEFFLWGFRNA